MPEGHTIHRLARDLRRDFEGVEVAACSPQGRFVQVQVIDGERLTTAHAIGKHLFLEFGAHRVHIHLGLFGKFKKRRLSEPPRSSVRLRLAPRPNEGRDGVDEGSRRDLAWDLTGPTDCRLLGDDAFEELRARLGADPLADGTRPTHARKRIQASKRPIGALLLDQSVIAGIGNVYRAELLFLSGLHPESPGQSITDRQFTKLWKLAKDLLAKGVRANRIVTVPLEERREAPRSRGEQLYVYKRRSCRRCQSTIVRSVVALRTMYHCPTCQPEDTRWKKEPAQ